MVSTGEKPQPFVGGNRVAMDRETATVLSVVTEGLNQRLQVGADRAPDETVPHSIPAGVRRHRETAGCIGAPLPAFMFCLPGEQEIFDSVPCPLDKGDPDQGGNRNWPKVGGWGGTER